MERNPPSLTICGSIVTLVCGPRPLFHSLHPRPAPNLLNYLKSYLPLKKKLKTTHCRDKFTIFMDLPFFLWNIDCTKLGDSRFLVEINIATTRRNRLGSVYELPYTLFNLCDNIYIVKVFGYTHVTLLYVFLLKLQPTMLLRHFLWLKIILRV